ncbi:hypothetical protein LZ31DRAFT_553671 [Colletotrichum somersetense]|nr:hypothetical protein LZ31DRAFT_553671 [Colletotrichum somersetense]
MSVPRQNKYPWRWNRVTRAPVMASRLSASIVTPIAISYSSQTTASRAMTPPPTTSSSSSLSFTPVPASPQYAGTILQQRAGIHTE